MPHATAALAAAALTLGIACSVHSSPSRASGFDPVSEDPPAAGAEPPARLVETTLASQGVPLPAIVYGAAGPGPHPTVVLLHGFPGNERNLDLAQAVRRAGWNVIFFHYRGAWGSGGDYSLTHVLEDTAAAVAWATDPANADALRGSPTRLALVGHSMGGFAALAAGSEQARVDCVASIAGANLGPTARAAAGDPELRRALAARLAEGTGPLSGTSGAALAEELAGAPRRFDLLRRAPALARKPLLLVAGSRDETTPPALHHEPLVEALAEHGAAALRQAVLPADHAFSGRRIALARLVVDWLAEDCGTGGAEAPAQ